MSPTRMMDEPDTVGLYLDEVGRHELLDHEGEIALAKRMEQGRAAAELLAAGGRLPAARRRELRRLVADGERAREAFIVANLRLVVSIARRFRATRVPLADLIQEGNLGLMHAVEKFDWRRGFKFSTYATWWIRQAISRGLSIQEYAIRHPAHVIEEMLALHRVRGQLVAELEREPTLPEIADATGFSVEQISRLLQMHFDLASLDQSVTEDEDLTLAEVVEDRSIEAPDDTAARALLPGEVDRLLAFLSEREREALTLRYGLDRGEPRTLAEVAEILGLSRERVRAIVHHAASKLRHPATGAELAELL